MMTKMIPQSEFVSHEAKSRTNLSSSPSDYLSKMRRLFSIFTMIKTPDPPRLSAAGAAGPSAPSAGTPAMHLCPGAVLHVLRSQCARRNASWRTGLLRSRAIPVPDDWDRDLRLPPRRANC